MSSRESSSRTRGREGKGAKRQVSGALGGVMSESTPYLGFNSPTSQFTITTSALYGGDGNTKTNKLSGVSKNNNSNSGGKSNSSPNDAGNIQRNKNAVLQ